MDIKNTNCPGFRNIGDFTFRGIGSLDYGEKGGLRQCVQTKYGLSQGDFYQMFAYGHHYLPGEGDMILIYPKTENFPETLQSFEFSDKLRLWVTPFDLQNDQVYWPSDLKTGIFTPSLIAG